MALAAFLLRCKTNLIRALEASETALIVSGNEAADLDSFASALLYAYLYPSASKEGSRVAEPTPLFPIPRADLALRPEIVHLLQQNDIPRSSVTFLDDLPKGISSPLEFILVDHNSPAASFKSLSSRWSVKSIIDHHDDTGSFREASPRIVTPAGSCSSLITNHFSTAWTKKGTEIETQLAKLALSAITIDTAGLTGRVTKHDEEAVQTLTSVLKTAGESINLQSLQQELQKRKSDVDGMGLRDLLRKDYKEWDVENLKIGISSIPVSLARVGGRFKDEEMDEAVISWATERKVDVPVVMTSFMDTEGAFRRELAVWNNENAPETAKAFVEGLLEHEHLKTLKLSEKTNTPKSVAGRRRVFVQENVGCSRKQVAPALISSLKSAL